MDIRPEVRGYTRQMSREEIAEQLAWQEFRDNVLIPGAVSEYVAAIDAFVASLPPRGYITEDDLWGPFKKARA